MPPGYRPIVVDNGSTRRLRRRSRAALGARVVDEPRAGLRRRLLRRAAARPTPTSSASWTATARSTRASCRASPARCSPATADLVLGARVAERGAWPLHARVANRAAGAASCAAAPARALHDLGPMRAARRERAARPGDRRPPLRLAAGDGAARGGRGLADRRGRRDATARASGARRSPAPCAGPRARSATWRAVLRMTRRADRASPRRPRPGASRRGCARRARRAQAAALAAAALADTLDAVAGDAGRPARARPRRRAGRLAAAPASRSSPQRGDGLDERLAHAFADVGGPALLVGMDTPQVTPRAARRGLERARRRRGRRGARARARRRLLGASACATPDRAPFLRRADEHRVRPARASARGCARSDCASALLPALRDVDRIADARAVAALAPGGRFAARASR